MYSNYSNNINTMYIRSINIVFIEQITITMLKVQFIVKLYSDYAKLNHTRRSGLQFSRTHKICEILFSLSSSTSWASRLLPM